MIQRHEALSAEEKEKLYDECRNKHIREMRVRTGPFSLHATLGVTLFYLIVGHKYRNGSFIRWTSPIVFVGTKTIIVEQFGDLTHRDYYTPEEAYILMQSASLVRPLMQMRMRVVYPEDLFDPHERLRTSYYASGRT